MRRLALLVAGGALWLVLAAIPALADGGPHQLLANNGSSGLSGDCAACHRAHTAQASSLLKAEMPGLCLTCHDGNGATTDVVDGYQYVPNSNGNPTTAVLGALRGGGFDTASIGSSDPARLSYTSTHGTSFVAHVGTLTTADGSALSPAVTTSTHGGTAGTTEWTSGTVWGNGAVNSGAGPTGVVLDCASCHNPHGNGQYRILQTTPGGDFTPTSGTFADTNSGGVQVQDVASPSSVHNYTILPGVQASDVITAGYTATQGDYWRRTAINSSGAPVLWTNTAAGKPDPMETGWQDYTASYVSGGATPTTKWLLRYPINTTELSTYKAALTTAGLTTDPISGATVANTVLDNRGGLMTAWCVQCHSRYSGQKSITGAAPNQGTSASSLTAMSPTDSIFDYKHGTTGVGCEQCHVSHGSNAQMVPGTAAAAVNWPGTAPVPANGTNDSRLLKVNNRGTCQLCHDPTGTYPVGQYIGPDPTPSP